MKYLLCFLMTCSVCFSDDLNIENLDAAAITISSGNSEGSGSVINKVVLVNGKEENVTFILTAAHVLEGVKVTRSQVIKGVEKKIVEFKDPLILQDVYAKGRKIGSISFSAKVIRYSDSETGHDIAILMVYARDKFIHSVKFVQDKEYVPPKGMELIHIASMHGTAGSNSFTKGNLSQVGRLLDGVGTNSKIFDQVSCSALPGSSGGQILRASDGLYIGCLVRGGQGGQFNFIIPVRRLHEFSKETGVEFLFDEVAAPPSLEELLKGEIEQ